MDESSLTKSNDTHLTSKVIEDMNEGEVQNLYGFKVMVVREEDV